MILVHKLIERRKQHKTKHKLLIIKDPEKKNYYINIKFILRIHTPVNEAIEILTVINYILKCFFLNYNNKNKNV